MNTEDKNAHNAGGNNGRKTEPTPPAGSSRIMTRRSALAGGMSALALGVLGAKKAAAQSAPLVLAGGLSQGHVVKLGVADATAWMQNMLSRSGDLQAYYNYYTAQGMSFILSRSQVYVHSATTMSSNPAIVPNIFGILPSFVQVNRSAPSHTAVGLGISQSGYVSAGSVLVNHNPFSIQQFTTVDYVPGTPPVFNPHTISAADLQNMTVCEVATQLGTPPVPSGFASSSTAVLADPDRSAVLAMTYQAILSDSYAAPLYPASGFSALIGQTSLVTKFAEGNYQRMANAVGAGNFCCCILTTCCCNGSTSCSLAAVAVPNPSLVSA